MASSDIIKIGFDYRSSLAQFEKDTDGVFDGISNKAGKQKITIQLDAKDDKVIDKIKELQKLKLDKFTFEFGDSGLKEQLQTFDKLENKINEIINLSKGIDLSFNTKNKTDAYNQLKKYADAFKDYYGNEEAMATNAGAKAGYAYYKAYEEALRKGVAQSKLEKVTIDFDVNDSIFSKERIVENRIKEFENFQKYGNADENNLIAEITLLENRLLKFNSAYSQVKANLGDAPITPEITKNIKNYVRLLEVAENRATDAELFGFSSEDINSDKDLANMYLDFAKEDATAENKKYIESLKQQETQAISTAEAEQKLAEAQKETVSNTSNSNNSQIEELKSDIQEVKTELGDVKDRISSIESNGFENVRDDVEKTKESVKELNSEFAEMKSNLSSTPQESNISSDKKEQKYYQNIANELTNIKDRHEGTHLIVEEIGKSESEILSIIRAENDEIKKGNELWKERQFYTDSKGNVVSSYKGDKNEIGLGKASNINIGNPTKETHIHPYNEDMAGSYSIGDVYNMHLAFAQGIRQFEFKWRDEILSLDFSNIDDKRLLSMVDNYEDFFAGVNRVMHDVYETNNDFAINRGTDLKNSYLAELVEKRGGTAKLYTDNYDGTKQAKNFVEISNAERTLIGTTAMYAIKLSELNEGTEEYNRTVNFILKNRKQLVDYYQQIGLLSQSSLVDANSLKDQTSLVQKFTQAFREYITAYEDYYGGNPGLSSFGIEKAGNTLTSLEKKYPELKSVRSNGYVNTSDDDLYNKALNEYLKRQDKLQSELKETEIQAEQTSLAVKEVITTTPKEDLKDAFPDKDISASVESATNSIKEENNVLEQNTQKVKENTQAKEQNANIDFSKYDKRLDSYNGKIDKYKTTIDRFNDGGWTSDAYLKNVQAVKNAVDEYETLLKELKGKDASLVTSEDISKLDNYEKKIKDTIATVTNMSAAEKGYKFEAGQKELDKIHKLLNENSRMSSDAKAKIKAYYKEIESGNPSMSLDRIHGEIMKIYNAEVEAGRAGRTLWDTLKNSRLHQMAAQLAGMFSIYDVINVVKEGINTVRELDTAMVEVEKVSDETEQSYANFRKTVSETATEIASTNKELLNSSADFLRLGYDINQASDLAKNATLFVNVGDGVDINEATEDMITAMKAFDIQAKDSIKIVDDYNQIGNLYALSATDIGEAMKRSASALETGNNTFEESIGLITAMNEIVQNSENTGNTLKVLSLRLRGAKAELESMSEDTDGLCDSTSKLREQIQALTGVDIMVDDNTFKSTADIIKELGAVWNNLTDSSQAATLEIIAGKTRANNVAALLKNYQQIDNVMQDLGDAEGSAEKENAAIVDSVEGRLKQLSASMESMWSTLLDSDALKTGISFLTSLVEGATNFVDVLDQIHAIIPSIIGLIGGLSFEKITNNTLDYI